MTREQSRKSDGRGRLRLEHDPQAVSCVHARKRVVNEDDAGAGRRDFDDARPERIAHRAEEIPLANGLAERDGRRLALAEHRLEGRHG